MCASPLQPAQGRTQSSRPCDTANGCGDHNRRQWRYSRRSRWSLSHVLPPVATCRSPLPTQATKVEVYRKTRFCCVDHDRCSERHSSMPCRPDPCTRCIRTVPALGIHACMCGMHCVNKQLPSSPAHHRTGRRGTVPSASQCMRCTRAVDAWPTGLVVESAFTPCQRPGACPGARHPTATVATQRRARAADGSPKRQILMAAIPADGDDHQEPPAGERAGCGKGSHAHAPKQHGRIRWRLISLSFSTALRAAAAAGAPGCALHRCGPAVQQEPWQLEQCYTEPQEIGPTQSELTRFELREVGLWQCGPRPESEADNCRPQMECLGMSCPSSMSVHTPRTL